ncbi:hypothetical protein ICM05_00670 [Leucobacter sp. cx-42]|uniref:hypothetical protein n=1 Tax=unclassified Leucobacter TaxID=2621730 RepID=UPI00165EA2DF|nr:MULTISPECIES: hypothetical protein [unclassified Leucobacter]MBC9953161.1 hypothetical protein [Leucobacter sp. cx-42]
MKIQVLSIDDCPSAEAALAHTRRALEAIGLNNVVVADVTIRTPEDAAAHSFAGSPTIIVDGDDLFESGGRTDQLACRVYPTEAGLKGAPTAEQIAAALEARLQA